MKIKDLKAAAKSQADKEKLTLSQWIFKIIKNDLKTK